MEIWEKFEDFLPKIPTIPKIWGLGGFLLKTPQLQKIGGGGFWGVFYPNPPNSKNLGVGGFGGSKTPQIWGVWRGGVPRTTGGGELNETVLFLKYDICLVREKCCYSEQMIP